MFWKRGIFDASPLAEARPVVGIERSERSDAGSEYSGEAGDYYAFGFQVVVEGFGAVLAAQA
jgi:hypothetical protein